MPRGANPFVRDGIPNWIPAWDKPILYNAWLGLCFSALCTVRASWPEGLVGAVLWRRLAMAAPLTSGDNGGAQTTTPQGNDPPLLWRDAPKSFFRLYLIVLAVIGN